MNNKTSYHMWGRTSWSWFSPCHIPPVVAGHCFEGATLPTSCHQPIITFCHFPLVLLNARKLYLNLVVRPRAVLLLQSLKTYLVHSSANKDWMSKWVLENCLLVGTSTHEAQGTGAMENHLLPLPDKGYRLLMSRSRRHSWKTGLRGAGRVSY